MHGLDRHSTRTTQIPLLLLKKTGRPVGTPAKTPQRSEERTSRRIRCPLCYWSPPEGSRWACYGPDPSAPAFAGCGTVWNTFATRGVCPGCSHRWQWTRCFSCGSWSPHDDWYEDET